MSLGRPLASEMADDPWGSKVPSARGSVGAVLPEPGDVSKRHETTTIFDGIDDELEMEGQMRKNRRRGVLDDDGLS